MQMVRHCSFASKHACFRKFCSNNRNTESIRQYNGFLSNAWVLMPTESIHGTCLNHMLSLFHNLIASNYLVSYSPWLSGIHSSQISDD